MTTSPTAEPARGRKRRVAGTPRRAPPVTWRINTAGARFGLFCFRYLRQTKGRHAGKQLALEPFQLYDYSDLLQLEHDVWLDLTDADARQAIADPATFWRRVEEWREEALDEAWGIRVHREGLLGVPKKNGKSTGSSGMALYLLVGDGEPGAEVYSTASTKDQARIVFRQATEMAEASPKLLAHLRIYTSQIERRDDGSFYKVVSADAGGLEGINPHGVVNDEIHAQKNREMYDTLRSATIYRDQPILFSITTAGVDVADTIGGELYIRGAGNKPVIVRERRHDQEVSVVRPRKDKQRSFFFRWYQADPKHAERPDEQLAANPASWITPAKLQEEAEVPRPRAIFYRYHCNIWTRVEQHWLPVGKWEKLRGRRGDETAIASRRNGEEEIRRGDRIVVTVDVGLWHDTAALIWARPPRLGKPDDPEDPVAVKAHIWGVHPDPRQPPPPAHEVEPGEGPVDLDAIETYIRDELVGRQGLRLLCVAADPYKFEDKLQAFEKRGIVAIRFDQGNASMVPASEGLYRSVLQDLVAHDGDEVLARHIENAAARDTGGSRWRLDKKKASDPMDGAVATAMAVELCHNEEIIRHRRPSATVL